MSRYSQIQNDLQQQIIKIVDFQKEFDEQIANVQKWLEEVYNNPECLIINKQTQKRGRKRPVIEAIAEQNEVDEVDENHPSKRPSNGESVVKSSENSPELSTATEQDQNEDNRVPTKSKSASKSNGESVTSKENTVESVSMEKDAKDDTNKNDSLDSQHSGVGRSKRAAAKVAALMNSKIVNQTINSKLRRPEEFNHKFEVQIKQEKLSILPSDNSHNQTEMLPPKDVPQQKSRKARQKKNVDELESNIQIKQEKPDRPTRTRSKQKLKKEPRDNSEPKNGSFDSDDVEIHPVQNEIVELSDSDDEVLRSSKNKNQIDEKIIEKDLNEPSEKQANERTEDEESTYEDAVQDPAALATSQDVLKSCSVQLNRIEDMEQLNSTYNIANGAPTGSGAVEIGPGTSKKVIPVLDETIVLEKTDKNTEKRSPKLNETVTISQNATKAKIRSPLSTKTQTYLPTYKNQQLFSPEGTVKKRVAELEKLNGSPTPVAVQPAGRVTRTKTRALKAATALAEECKENVEDKKAEAAGFKIKSTTTTKLNNLTTSAENLLRPANILKAPSKTDLRDEEIRKKLEKVDVIKKKDALLTAKVEEQRRKREERALKAQQAREQKEKERQQQLERQERERLEKQRQAQLERDLKKKEIERRAALAEQRAKEIEDRRRAEDMARHQRLLDQEEAERKREQEDAEQQYQKRLQEQAEQAKANARAQKLVTAAKSKLDKINKKNDFASPLPNPAPKTPKTATPYPRTTLALNTDDESDEEKDREVPMWSSSEFRNAMAMRQNLVHRAALLQLFSTKPLKSVNIRTIFPEIEISRVRRDSSAVWRTPPRYSQMKKN